MNKTMKLLCSRSVFLFALVLSGCGGLQEMTEGPGAKSFHPKSIAVLPPIAGQYEDAREELLDVLDSALVKRRHYERIVSAEQMADIFQTKKEALDALMAFTTKFEATGQPDKASAAVLGKSLNAEALLLVRVRSWEYVRKEADNLASVGFSLRLINPVNGSIVWKGRHEKIKSYMFFKPELKDLAADLAEEMINYMPK